MTIARIILTGLLCFLGVSLAAAQVTNLVVNGSSTSFTMNSGDVIEWTYDIPTGATAIGEIWIDVNGNQAADPGTDRQMFTFTQTDGDPSGDGGPPDDDGLVNGQVHFAQAVGLAPATYIMIFTHNGVSASVWGTVQPLASPAFTVSGTVSGPGGADLANIIVSLESSGEGDGGFWNALTDSLGAYTIAMGPDTAGNPWRVRLEGVPRPYIASPPETLVTIDGNIAGVDFTLNAAAAQVVGRLLDDQGDTLAYREVYLQRVDTTWSNVSQYSQTDASGEFWFGVDGALLNGNTWKLQQPYHQAPITTHLLAAADVGVLGNGDSVVRNLVAYRVNATIEGYFLIDGSPAGFPVTVFASNADSGESFAEADSTTGAFSIPVSDAISTYSLWPNNLGGPYFWSFVTASAGDTGVIVNASTTGVDDRGDGLPSGFSLSQNYPNPFNPATTISYDVPIRSHVRLAVYDALGREVALLVNDIEEPGRKSVRFDAGRLSTGVYALRLSAPGFSDMRKMLLLR